LRVATFIIECYDDDDDDDDDDVVVVVVGLSDVNTVPPVSFTSNLVNRILRI